LPIIAALAWLTAWRAVWGKRDWLPFVATIVLLLSALAGPGVSGWPWAIPGVMTIWQAASMHRTQMIVAGAILAILPVVLSYIAFSYWVFRQKITASSGSASSY
jgi:cytochrome d ubiquinol oxidase subunit II